eukprot:1211657-Pleurochrysis_carterae.AAC.1
MSPHASELRRHPLRPPLPTFAVSGSTRLRRVASALCALLWRSHDCAIALAPQHGAARSAAHRHAYARTHIFFTHARTQTHAHAHRRTCPQARARTRTRHANSPPAELTKYTPSSQPLPPRASLARRPLAATSSLSSRRSKPAASSCPTTSRSCPHRSAPPRAVGAEARGRVRGRMRGRGSIVYDGTCGFFLTR